MPDPDRDLIDHHTHVIGEQMAPGYDPPSTSLAAPAEQPHTAPAAPDPHPDTPDGAAGAQAALIDSNGVVWRQHGANDWRCSTMNGGRSVTRAYVESDGPATEVLLVSPAAGRVLDAARQWRDLDRVGGASSGPDTVLDALDTLAAAVDALDGDQPAEPTPKRSPARLVADPVHTCVTPRGRRDDCAGCSAEAAELAIESSTPTPDDEAEMDADIAEFAALPDCGHCAGTGKQVPDGWYERRRETERRAAQVLGPAVERTLRDAEDGEGPCLSEAQAAARAAGRRLRMEVEPAPEPDSLYEQLAAIEHHRWADWQRYMHSLCERRDDSALVIPADRVAHWERQIDTPYTDLTEAEKAMDREQVGRYWHLVSPAAPEPDSEPADDCLRTGVEVRARGEALSCGNCGYTAAAHPGDGPASEPAGGGEADDDA